MSNLNPHPASIAAKTERILRMRESQYNSPNPAPYTTEVYAKPHTQEAAWWKHTSYKTGDGDHTNQPMRPGSDHSHLKSLGNLT